MKNVKRNMRCRLTKRQFNDLFIRELVSKFTLNAVSEIMNAFMNSKIEFKFDFEKIVNKLRNINYSCHLIDKILNIAKNCKIEFV